MNFNKKKFNLVELLWQNVWDIIPRMTVESLFKSFLIHVMANETNATAQYEQWIDGANVNVFLSFLATIEKQQQIKQKLIRSNGNKKREISLICMEILREFVCIIQLIHTVSN